MYPSEKSEPVPAQVPKLKIPHLRLGAIIAVALAAFFVAWLLLSGDDGGGKSASTTGGTAATIVSKSDLEQLAESTDHPIYWAGERKNESYELTQTQDGRIFIRYLSEGVKAGDPRPNFLAVGTYPRKNAFAELTRATKRKGSVSVKIENGGLVVFTQDRPTNVYFAYPKGGYQVEVYAPSGQTARRLVLSGKVQPVK
jgi:hypothetical protein